MAWNPSPKVADCREIARKWGGKHQVVIIAIDRAAGTIEMATYGQTKALCNDAKRMGDAAYDAVMNSYEDEVLPGAKPHTANDRNEAQ